MIFAKSASELREMLELLDDELDAIGFEMHSIKSKIMTSFNDLDVDFSTICNSNLAIFLLNTPHGYVGRSELCSTNR